MRERSMKLLIGLIEIEGLLDDYLKLGIISV